MAFDFAKTADRILELQNDVDKIETAAQAKTAGMKAEIKDLEERLMLAMNDAGMKKIEGKHSLAEVKTKLRVSIADFEKLAQFVYRNKLLHLFERRIGIKAYEELKDAKGGKELPGLSEFRQPTITVKKAK